MYLKYIGLLEMHPPNNTISTIRNANEEGKTTFPTLPY